MKTLLSITLLLFLTGCGTDTTPKSSVTTTTPPQPTASGTIQPPASPALE